jgi:prepilin-type N-terminal cleavage/methylation domain-containing protein
MPQPRGYSLAEVLIVVGIIGVLSTLAIAIPTRFIRQARQAEATAFLSAIAVKEENFHAHFGRYLSAPANPATLPRHGDRLAWDDTDAAWRRLGANPRKGQVYFQYRVVSGLNTPCNDPVPCAGVSSRRWWWAEARNGDATLYINSASLQPWLHQD